MAAAYSARQLGVPATIVVPSVTPNPTVERLKDEGANVVIHGKVSSRCVFLFSRNPVTACPHNSCYIWGRVKMQNNRKSHVLKVNLTTEKLFLRVSLTEHDFSFIVLNAVVCGF